MDSLTQAALGAAIGHATLGRYIGRRGMILGAVVATIPDLDVALYLCYDRFDMLSIHRGYSHSILFCLLLSIVLTLVFKRIRRRTDIPLFRLWLFHLLALTTHPLLDAFTAYGTQLFLPFSDCRFGWDSINVVDPIYTLPLIAGLMAAMYFERSSLNLLGLALSSIYLLSTLFIKDRITDRLLRDLTAEHVDHIDIATIPVGVASLHWYGMARDEQRLYLKKYALLDDSTDAFQVFDRNEELLDLLTIEQSEVMRWFAKGFYTVSKEGNDLIFYNLQVDMRGVVHTDSIYAPTVGYFRFSESGDGTYEYGSGSHD